MKSLNPLIQLNRQLHYLFVALLFASFAVAQSVQAASDKMIRFDYTTEPIFCAFNEQVELHGTILIAFKQKGKKGQSVTASLQSFQGVGLTSKREYVADNVTFQIVNLSQPPIGFLWTHPGFSLLLPTGAGAHTARVIISVTGKHPTGLNSATGDPLPGQDVHFQLVYTIGWISRAGRVTQFIPDVVNPDGQGVISCN